jgi:hypothetical protein
LDEQLNRRRDAFGQPSPANTSVLAGLGCVTAWVLYLLSGVAS